LERRIRANPGRAPNILALLLDIAAALERGLEITVRIPKTLAGAGSFAAIRDVADFAAFIPNPVARCDNGTGERSAARRS